MESLIQRDSKDEYEGIGKLGDFKVGPMDESNSSASARKSRAADNVEVRWSERVESGR